MIFSGLTLYAEHITIEVAPQGPTLTNKAPAKLIGFDKLKNCLLYTSPSPRDAHESRMPSSA